MSERPSLSLADPLPRGRLAVEASAGTGKTYALATLAARFVAEADVAIDQLLIVTFTRAAAAELRDRVRARLVDLAVALADDAAPTDPALVPAWSQDRDRHRERVQRALSDFDAATITTIHGFAQQVLGTLGAAARSDPDAVLVDDGGALARQVATDRLVAAALDADADADALPSLDHLLEAAHLALGNPAAALVPDDGPVAGGDGPAAARLRRLVDEVAAEVDRRRRAGGTLSFDDLLVRLRDALAGAMGGEDARRALARRYRVALIDEFQDTDPVQWAILDRVFGGDDDGEGPLAAAAAGRATGPQALVLVGDPKQAIYAFRGADVHTYLQATGGPGVDRTGLGTSWRSDPALLAATRALLEGATFGDERIGFHPVEAPPEHAGRALLDADGAALPALSVRLVGGDDLPRTKAGHARVEGGDLACFADLADHVAHLLATAHLPEDATGAGGTRPLRPDDVAVLVTTNREGPVVRDALARRGIPAVIARGDSVLTSEAAAHWHRLLAAVARPTDVRRARAATLTWFFGWDVARLAAADDDELAAVQEQLHGWGEHLSARGVAAFVGRVWAATGVAEHVLALPDGDRSMTDLEHVAELLSLAAARNASPTTLLGTFEALAGGDEDGDPETDVAARRVESEARAVQILTTYVAKGLEFPVVCCPSLWRQGPVEPRANVWWDTAAGRRTIDVASHLAWGDDGEAEARKAAAVAEAVGGNLRVLYVALTRARHHTAVWWLPTAASWKTGLGRVLFARDDDGRIDPDAFTSPAVDPLDGDAMAARLAPVVASSAGALEAVAVDAAAGGHEPWHPTTSGPAAAELAVATLDRALDRSRRVWSFTALTADAHGGAGYDPHADALGDAADADEAALATTGADAHGAGADAPGQGSLLDAAPVPLGEVAGGAGFGTLVHEVLERADVTVEDLEDELARHVADRLAWSPWPVDEGALVAGLAAVVRTPLGPRFADRPLTGLATADRLDELAFDLTLGEAGARATDADVGRLLLDGIPADDPLRPWAEAWASTPSGAVLAGSLTGSIDLVARVRHHDGAERFVVCDYKTNRLAAPDEVATVGHYRPDRLPAAMAAHDYPLQALLYAVALHRYLRWRLPGYDPDVHLGGVGYLFVRGLAGPGTPTVGGVPHGLFSWDLPPGLVPALSDLLDGRGGAR